MLQEQLSFAAYSAAVYNLSTFSLIDLPACINFMMITNWWCLGLRRRRGSSNQPLSNRWLLQAAGPSVLGQYTEPQIALNGCSIWRLTSQCAFQHKSVFTIHTHMAGGFSTHTHTHTHFKCFKYRILKHYMNAVHLSFHQNLTYSVGLYVI